MEQYLTKRNLFLLVFVIVIGVTFLIYDFSSSPTKENNKSAQLPKEGPKNIPYALKRQLAKQQAEKFIKEYFTYDTRNMNRSKRIKEMVSTPLYLEEVQVDVHVRPTAGFVASTLKKMENVDIQPLHEGFLWTGTLITEDLDGEGKKSIVPVDVTVVLQPVTDDPTKWLVSEVVEYDS